MNCKSKMVKKMEKNYFLVCIKVKFIFLMELKSLKN